MRSWERKDFIPIIKRNSAPLTAEKTGLKYSNNLSACIRACVFDIYGTLFISGSGDIGISGPVSKAEIFLEAFFSAGFEPQSGELGLFSQKNFEAYIRNRHAELQKEGIEYPEVRIESIWSALCGDAVTEGYLSSGFTEEMIYRLAIEYETRVNPVWPMGDLSALFRELRGKGIVLGIVSNAQFYTPLLFPAFLDAELEDLGFPGCLQIFSYEYEEAKPSQRLFEPIVTTLFDSRGIPPEETLYIGNDMLNDIFAASASGLTTCLFAGDRRSLRLRENHPCCNDLHPDAIVVSIEQILSLL